MTYLIHHGIKGQSWGVRNGPPYPLGAGAKSAKEKKAENTVSKTSNSSLYSKNSIGKKVCDRVLAKNEKTGLGEELVIYALVYSIAILASLGITIHNTKKDMKREEEEAEERYKNRQPKHISELPKLEQPMEPADSMKVTNPGFPGDGHVYNCTFCTTAMVLREKGYNVQAQTTSHAWYTTRYWQRTFGIDQQTEIRAKSSKDVVSALESNGPNAYGNVSVYWKLGGGHSIFWKNDSEGKLHIYDGQSGEEYETDSKSKLMRAIDPGSTSYCRLDNVEPTDYALAFVTPVEAKEASNSNDSTEGT